MRRRVCRHWHVAAVTPAVVFLALAVPKVWQGAFSVDTGWYAAISLQAWRNALDGDMRALWSLRGIDGLPFFNKPPFPFWVHGLFLQVFGPSIWAARLPAVAAGLGAVLLTQHAAARLRGRTAGVLAGVVLATTIEFTRHTHAVSLDMWMTLFLTGALGSALTPEPSRPSRGVITGAWVGLALLCKPFVALAALPIFAAWAWYCGRISWRQQAVSLAAALFIPSIWHLSMAILHGREFADQYIGREVVERAAGNLANLNDGSATAWYYLVELARNGWPWLVTALLGMVAILRREFGPRERAVAILCAVWCVAWLAALSVFPDRRARYLLPIYPSAAILSALFLLTIPARPFRIFAHGIARAAWAPAIVVAVLMSALPVRVHRPDEDQWLAFFDWMEANGRPQLVLASGDGATAARVYLRYGVWPRPTRRDDGSLLVPPSDGQVLLYNLRCGLAPGESEATLFESHRLIVTRLERAPWTPRSIQDPGE